MSRKRVIIKIRGNRWTRKQSSRSKATSGFPGIVWIFDMGSGTQAFWELRPHFSGNDNGHEPAVWPTSSNLAYYLRGCSMHSKIIWQSNKSTTFLSLPNKLTATAKQ